MHQEAWTASAQRSRAHKLVPTRPGGPSCTPLGCSGNLGSQSVTSGLAVPPGTAEEAVNADPPSPALESIPGLANAQAQFKVHSFRFTKSVMTDSRRRTQSRPPPPALKTLLHRNETRPRHIPAFKTSLTVKHPAKREVLQTTYCARRRTKQASHKQEKDRAAGS